MGMPECELALAQAAVYLSLAAKSNALYTAYGAVKREVAERPGLAIPMAVRNAPTTLMKDAGYGAGYRYAHDERGAVADDALALIAALAAGDARQALNHLELAVAVARSEGLEAIGRELVQRVSQNVVAVYDKGGEEHYNLISALHKAVRNSDPDAALYWLGRMLAGGADPRFVARRMFRMASEDVGMADPRALEQVAAAAHAVEHMGMPECELALAQAAVYLSLAAKSNALYTAYGAVKREVAERPGLAIPMAVRNAPTTLMKDAGYGAGYRYAHDERGAVADLECLPDELAGARFYQPTPYGWEARIRERLAEIGRLREEARKKS
jgi:putative ATPase